MSILDLATPVQETVESINMVLYGDNGVGKTHFAGSGRDHGKNDLIIAVEQGTVSAARAGSQASVLHAKDYDTLMQIIEAVEAEPDRFEWVVLDSLTKTQDLIWDHILGTATERNPSRSRYKKELQEYGEAQERLKEIVERLVSCEANVIFTAQAELDVDEESQEYKRPQLHGRQGAIAQWVCAQVDLVGYLRVAKYKGKTYRRFEFNKEPEFYAKDRFAAFPTFVPNLTLEKMTDTLLGAGVEEEANNNENSATPADDKE